MRSLSIDIESYSSIDIKKAGLHRYAQSPDFQILLFAYSFDGAPVTVIDLAQGEQLTPELVEALQDPDIIKRAWNAPFEQYCLSKFYHTPIDQWRDSMMHALYCGYPAALGAAAVALGLPEDKRKMSVGMSLIRTFCVPTKPSKANGYRTRTLPHHEPEKWQLFKSYNAQDVVTEMEIENRLNAFPVPEQEQQLWVLDQQINARGVRVDMDLVNAALAIDEVMTAELTNEAVHLSGLNNPKSVKQLTKWLEEETGEEIDNLRKDTVKDLIKSADEGAVKRMLEIRQELSKTSVKKYTAMRGAVGTDGRIRGLLQFYGANRTGRWTGRLVQVQNLPRNYLETLGFARQLVKDQKLDALKIIYGNVPDTLSQLIRTAFIPTEGNRFIVSDFSAIEARVIAWLAGEQWRLDVFNTHGKIYEASASQMFGIPLELIKKGNPEYELRQKGKIAELALGYGGGSGALISMDSKKELNEDELPEIVHRWRSANKRIVDLWYSLENAALDVMHTGQAVGVKGLILARESEKQTDQDFLTIQLPSGRKLYYPKPFIGMNDRGQEALYYRGVNQTTKKWEEISTWGGKLVENCLGANTEVLTERGWVSIINVSKTDRVWDGDEWVKHDGVIFKGVQSTINLDGVFVTPDHLILTETGWENAEACEGHYRASVSLPRSNPIRRIKRAKISLGDPLRLWQNVHDGFERILKRQTEVLRVSAIQIDFKKSYNTRNVSPSSVCSMAINDRSMQASIASSLAQLRRSWNQGVSAMGRKFRIFLGRYGADLPTRTNDRTNRRQWQLHTGKLLLGYSQKTGQEQTHQSDHFNTVGGHDRSRGRRAFWNWSDNASLSSATRLARKPFILQTGRTESVYDILNAGHRHRFVVKGANGPIVVHNCVQAISRDCLAVSLVRLANAEYQNVMHVHDEVILDTPNDFGSLEEVTSIMSLPIPWAPGLPLKAAGFEADFYKKD